MNNNKKRDIKDKLLVLNELSSIEKEKVKLYPFYVEIVKHYIRSTIDEKLDCLNYLKLNGEFLLYEPFKSILLKELINYSWHDIKNNVLVILPKYIYLDLFLEIEIEKIMYQKMTEKEIGNYENIQYRLIY